MKTEKESLGFKLFWFLVTFAPLFFMFSFLLLSLNLDFRTHISISSILSLFLAKNIIDKQDLENKIFELKQLLEDEKR